MKNPPFTMLRAVCSGLFLLAAGAAPLDAQGNTAPDAADEAGEVVVLPEFRVQAKDDGSYLATESTSGTRITVPISSLPYSIQVLTADFINDFQLFDLSDQAPYISGMAPGDPADGSGSGTLLRGFSVLAFRNGFYRTQAPESSSIARVEVIKGPQSAIYGRVSPGGLVNFISKKPQTRFATGASAAAGSYDYFRTDAYVTGPLVARKLYYRLDVSYNDMERNTDYWFTRTFNLSGGMTYKITPDTSLTFEFEHTDKLMNSIVTRIRYLDRRGSEDRNDWIISGSVWDLPDKNVAERLMTFGVSGSESRVSRQNDSYYLQLEHRFSQTLSLRVNLSRTDREYWTLNARAPMLWDPVQNCWVNTSKTGFAPANRTNPSYQKFDYDETGGQVDLTKIWRTRVRQRSLLTFDYFRNRESRHQWSLTGANLDNALSSLGLSAAEIVGWKAANPLNLEPKYSVLPAFSPEFAWTSVDGMDSLSTSIYDRDLLFFGALFNHTMEFFDGRLNLVGSIRQDYSEIENNNPANVNANLQEAGSNVENFCYSTGVTFHVIPKKLIAYASYGTSFNPVPRVDPITGAIYGNTTAEGGEAGLKGLLMSERFSYTLAFYRVRQENEVTDNPAYFGDPDPVGNRTPRYMEGGATLARGVGLDISGRLLPGLAMVGNASWVSAEVAENKGSPALIGTRPVNIPVRSFGLGMTWRPQSFLKGARLGVSYKYQARHLYMFGSDGGATAFDYAPLYLPSTNEWAMFAGYNVRLRKKITADIGVNVMNLFDQKIPSPAFYAPNGREIRFTARISF
jgi:outer membrane receptor protein involved in Fe transport